MPDIQSAQEIHSRLARPDRAMELHKEATEKGMTLSRYLEVIDPSPEGAKLDAFGRQLREAGIVTRNNPAAGFWSSPAMKFFDNPAGRALYPEFFARQWRSVSFASPQQRATSIILSSDDAIGSITRPWADAGAPQWLSQFQPAIPLTELVATTQPIQGEDYRSLYMTYDENALRLFRIGESAEIPMATLTTSSRSNRLRKYGRGLRTTYEQLRRMTVDRMAWWIKWQALQAEVDKVTAALSYLISGDGNSNTAATVINQSTLDADAVVNELSLKAWLNFRMQFTPPYTMTTALMQTSVALQVILLNSGSANVPLVGLNLNGVGNSLTPINQTADGIRYGWTSEAPANKIIGFDKRFALEQVTEIGSEIRETERFITNQTEVMVMTENSGFSVIDASGTKILNLAA